MSIKSKNKGKGSNSSIEEPINKTFQKGEDSIWFKNGVLGAETYSYEISSTGFYELSVEQTKELYEAMKLYFEC